MTDEGRTRLGTVRTELTVAFELEDVVTGDRPRGSPRVSLANRPERPMRTPSGYHVVTDVPGDASELTAVVEGESYLTERRTIDLAEVDRSTAQTIELTPSPAFPFDGGVTLVRGFVTDGGDSLSGATVTIQGRSEATRTDERGEFVLPIRDLADGDVTGSGTLQVEEGTPTLEATHPDAETTASAETAIAIGATTRRDLSF